MEVAKEEYLAIGRELLSEPISDQIMGYDTEYRRVRYDIARNIFVLGDIKRGQFTTILKLLEGADYYEQDWQREFGDY